MEDKIQNDKGIDRYNRLREIIINVIGEGLGVQKTFKINNFLSLQLRDGETYIMVKNRTFIGCKYLLIDIPVEKVETLDMINSIDEASELLDNSMERKKIDIPDESIFWGHCSNLQAWYEHGYDTRLLHRNLAFPLLKKLAQAGDPQAQRIFKEEVAQRFSSGHLPVVAFLLEGGYLDKFTNEEKETLFTSSNIVSILLDTIFQKIQSSYHVLAHELLTKLVKSHERIISQLIIHYQKNNLIYQKE